MANGFKSAALRYGLALGVFVLLLLFPYALRNLFAFSFDTTFLIIIAMIAAAWYLGRGPGLLIAVLFEAALIYFSTAPFSTRSVVITFNRLLLFVGVVLFASARRNAERKLREQHELLQVTLKSIGDAVIATVADGRINFINPTAESLTGWKMPEAVNRPLDEVFRVVNEETRQPVENPFAAVMKRGAVVGLANHTILLGKDGREIPIEDSGAPIRDADGRIVGVIIVFHDVSERRRAERERERLLASERASRAEAEAANRLKDEFLATVSHELRTPLNAILGWSAILNQRQKQRGGGILNDETARNAIDIIERNAKAQAEIVSDILDVSRIITGKLRIRPEPVEIAPIILSAVESLQPAANAKEIEIKVNLENTSALIAGDSDRLRQVVWNLISNAIKFTPARGRIEIQSRHADSQIEISVSDTGIGINAEFLPHVFERFSQADSSTTRAGSGLGLGLAIVRHLVELHGGTVSAVSEGDSRGATFIVRFPVLFMDAAAQGEKEKAFHTAADLNDKSGGNGSAVTVAAKSEPPDLSGVRVLLVDDDRDSRDVLCLMLERYGADVRGADSAASALKTFAVWKPDVLISDIGMPGEDGFDLIAKVRALAPEQGGGVPAAALTAYVREEDRQKALATGFHAHISKPVEPAALAAAVAGLVKQQKTAKN